MKSDKGCRPRTLGALHGLHTLPGIRSPWLHNVQRELEIPQSTIRRHVSRVTEGWLRHERRVSGTREKSCKLDLWQGSFGRVSVSRRDLEREKLIESVTSVITGGQHSSYSSVV
jgi:hypothetical protein